MKSVIRNIVHDILLETRANLSIRPLMKQWVKIALDHGKNDTKALCAKLQGSIHETVQKTVGLRVPKNKSHLVFEGLTAETQEWVLKHWKTEEYFSNMISGVILGIVTSYGNGSNAIGQKSGETNIKSGTYNEADGTWVGGSDGYLTMKSNLHAVGHGSSMFHNVLSSEITPNNVNSLKVNKNNFKDRCMKDLRQSDSVLYHEFQHWFQETVMFADERLKTPTKGSKKGTGWSVPKDFIDQKIPPKQVSMMILKQLVKGIDFSSPKEHPTLKIPMYEIQSMPSLIDSVFQHRVGSEHTVWPTELYGKKFVKRGQSIDDGGWMKDFVENTLKIPLTPAGEELLYVSLEPLYRISHFVHYGKKKEKAKHFRLNKSGELPKKQAESIRAAKMPVDVFFVPKSHMVKDKNKVFTGEIKPNKKLVAASTKQLSKDHMYIIFARSTNWNRKNMKYQTWIKRPYLLRNKIEKEKNPLYDDGNRRLSWDQRWIEFDAESRNYLAHAVDLLVKDSTRVFLKALVISDEEKMTKLLVMQTNILLKNRIDRSITRQNEAELISMCSRIADKFVEEAEAMTLFDFQDNNPPGYQAPWRPSTEKNVRDWLKGGKYFESRYADYWKYIKDRVFGEV